MSKQPMKPADAAVLALCGGIGGAKLALGLYKILDPGSLAVVVNTGDDFEHLGLHISPDLDTVLYTLSGLSDLERGWGRAHETWNFMDALRGLGGEDWFQLGDRDLAMHVERTHWLRSGRPLTAYAFHAAKQLGIAAHIIPMSDQPVRTLVNTSEGELPFQNYFVRRRCEPVVTGIRFAGVKQAHPAPAFLDVLAGPRLKVIVICPSNPYLSIDPILSIPKLRSALVETRTPVIAVSPIIGGKAIKGPTAKIMAELGIATTNQAIAQHYHGLIDGLVIDTADAGEAATLDLPVHVAPILMRDLADRQRLAQEVVKFAGRIAAANGATATSESVRAKSG